MIKHGEDMLKVISTKGMVHFVGLVPVPNSLELDDAMMVLVDRRKVEKKGDFPFDVSVLPVAFPVNLSGKKPTISFTKEEIIFSAVEGTSDWGTVCQAIKEDYEEKNGKTSSGLILNNNGLKY